MCKSKREKREEDFFFIVPIANSFFFVSYLFKIRGVVDWSEKTVKKMNVSASECGSGCESGWTHYLDNSYYSQTRYQKFSVNFVVEDEEQDLSMVSDASSGPRHYYQNHGECHDENGSFCSVPATPEPDKRSSKSKQKIKEHGSNQQHSYLDDTASSPVISFSKKNCKKEASIDLLDFSQGFSGTHLKAKSTFHKKIGFLKSGKSSSKDSGGFQ